LRLTGANKWSAGATSDPIADVNTGHAFMRGQTGLTANIAVIDYDTMVTLRRHPLFLDLYKQVQGGQVTDAQIAEQFRVKQILIADAILENAKEGGTSSMTNMWGNICLLAHVEPAQSMEDVTTFGLGFRWTDPELGAPFAIRTYDDADPGKRSKCWMVSTTRTRRSSRSSSRTSSTTRCKGRGHAMNREFTRDVGRYKKGYRPTSWPLATWQAVSPGVPLHQFSKPLDAEAHRPGDEKLQKEKA
jgi:hypothetical protein